MSPLRVEIRRGPSRVENESFMDTMDDLHDAKVAADVEGYPLIGGRFARELGCDLLLPGIADHNKEKADKFAEEVKKKKDLTATVVYYDGEER
jgi:hypothetical protein